MSDFIIGLTLTTKNTIRHLFPIFIKAVYSTEFNLKVIIFDFSSSRMFAQVLSFKHILAVMYFEDNRSFF